MNVMPSSSAASTGFLLALLPDPEDGSNMLSLNYTALQSRKLIS
jgi:hypothetical protein